jgi:hypothetical protein
MRCSSLSRVAGPMHGTVPLSVILRPPRRFSPILYVINELRGGLAKSYARVTQLDKANRDAAFREFSGLYSVRSGIMHGRTHKVAATEQLPTLARFQEVLRRLWRTVLSSPELKAALEDTDRERKTHFQVLEHGYPFPS